MHMKTISNKKTSRWVKVIGLSFIIFHLSIGHALAQQAGDIITGTVSDDFGPVMMANVVELDASNRIVASTQTDINGNFSFKIKNPKDKLRISYVGLKTQTLPINQMEYDIKMVDQNQLVDVVVLMSFINIRTLRRVVGCTDREEIYYTCNQE